MRILLIAASFLWVCHIYSQSTSSAIDHISIDFPHGCLTSHQADTGIFRGLPAGADCMLRFDKGVCDLKDSICILTPYEIRFAAKKKTKVLTALFGGIDILYPPGKMDSGCVYLFVKLPGDSSYKTITKKTCIQQVPDDLMKIKWGSMNMHTVTANKMSYIRLNSMLDKSFTYKLNKNAKQQKFQSVSIHIHHYKYSESFTVVGNKLDAQVIKYLKSIPDHYYFVLSFHKHDRDNPDYTTYVAVFVTKPDLKE